MLYHKAFIDCLFLCYSPLTVTGLSTVNLSSCTVLQQAILYVLMMLGNVVRPSSFPCHLYIRQCLLA